MTNLKVLAFILLFPLFTQLAFAAETGNSSESATVPSTSG